MLTSEEILIKADVKYILISGMPLTHLVSESPSYRNQSIDLYSKSIGWLLYESKTGT